MLIEHKYRERPPAWLRRWGIAALTARYCVESRETLG